LVSNSSRQFIMESLPMRAFTRLTKGVRGQSKQLSKPELL